MPHPRSGIPFFERHRMPDSPRYRRAALLRLTVVTETWPPEINGVAATLARFVAGMVVRGHMVTLVRPRQSPSDDGSAEPIRLRTILTPGLAIPAYPMLRLGLPAVGLLTRAWTAEPPQVVHIATEGPLGWAALQVARRLNLPVSSDYRTNFDAYNRHYGIGWLRWPITAWLRRFHNRCGVTMVPTEALRLTLAAKGFQRLCMVSRGVDTLQFDPVRRSRTLRAAWGASEDAPVAIAVGRLAPEKNLDLAVRAFESIRAVRPNARLVFVGDGPSHTALAQRCPWACFTGARRGEDLAAHYASADLLLFPSLTETFGNVVLEAMASGLPVVAFDDAAAGAHVAHGVSGRLAAIGDEEAFVRHAVAIATDAANRHAAGLQARRHVLPLGWPTLVAHFEAVVAAVVDDRQVASIGPAAIGFNPRLRHADLPRAAAPRT
jgi:glycosyltransferase involved in cell wall biosynthesis